MPLAVSVDVFVQVIPNAKMGDLLYLERSNHVFLSVYMNIVVLDVLCTSGFWGAGEITLAYLD